MKKRVGLAGTFGHGEPWEPRHPREGVGQQDAAADDDDARTARTASARSDPFPMSVAGAGGVKSDSVKAVLELALARQRGIAVVVESEAGLEAPGQARG